MKEKKESSSLPQNSSRREFLKTAALTAGAAGVLGAGGLSVASAKQGQKKSAGLPITIAGYDVRRVEALADGRVQVKGCDAKFEVAGIGDMNTNVFSGEQTRDVTEVGLHHFMLAYANNNFRDYTLLPIFPLRVFRHKSIFIRTDRGIKGPENLRGKKIGTPGYSSTSLTWLRGIFQDEYGISPNDVQWVVAAKDSSAKVAGKISKQENIWPKGVPVRQGPEGQDESDLLASGLVDALCHAAEPKCYVEGHSKVGRLFPDYRTVEQAYFKKTGIFPIMHAVAIKKSTAKENPWLPKAVFNAYSNSKQMSYDYMAKLAWAYDSLPWYGQEFEETRAIMGDNYYSYGIGPNRKVLETLFRYSHEQGLAKRELTIEELFESSSLKLTES